MAFCDTCLRDTLSLDCEAIPKVTPVCLPDEIGCSGKNQTNNGLSVKFYNIPGLLLHIASHPVQTSVKTWHELLYPLLGKSAAGLCPPSAARRCGSMARLRTQLQPCDQLGTPGAGQGSMEGGSVTCPGQACGGAAGPAGCSCVPQRADGRHVQPQTIDPCDQPPHSPVRPSSPQPFTRLDCVWGIQPCSHTGEQLRTALTAGIARRQGFPSRGYRRPRHALAMSEQDG